MKRELIAIVTCHAPKYRERANAQRATWAQHANACGYDLKFFLGTPPNGERPGPDEIFLDVGDGYHSMPAKVQAMCVWAAAQGYPYVFKTDDDVYVNMNVLKTCQHEPHDYVGRFRGSSGGYPADYASGYGYWLSNLGMRIIANAQLTEDWAEDRWVGNVMCNAGIQGRTDDKHYVACYPPVLPQQVFSSQISGAAAFCEYPPHLMHLMYKCNNAARIMPLAVPLRPVPFPAIKNYSECEPEQSPTITLHRKHVDLSSLCVLIKTFLRDGYLFDCIAGLERNFPDVQMVIMDDGKPSARKDTIYKKLRAAGHVCEYMPYDSGFGEKSNAAIYHYKRPYVLIGSDDFDFNDPNVRYGIEKMLTVIQSDPKIAVASGRVDNTPYEALLEVSDGCVREIPLTMGDWLQAKGVDYKLCDLTVNFSIIRTSVLGKAPGQVCWDGGDVKIGGGEHGAFFLDLKHEGHKVAFVPGADITSMRYDPKKEDPAYATMRDRARKPGRVCIRKRGIKRWIMRDGTSEAT